MPPRPGRTPSALSAVIPDSTGPECHPLGSWGHSRSPSQGVAVKLSLGSTRWSESRARVCAP